jgi:small subunit ribosomal protein S6
MQFDSSIPVQNEIRRTLGLDPRMIRFSILKVGDKLGTPVESIENEDGGGVEWKKTSSQPSFREERMRR